METAIWVKTKGECALTLKKLKAQGKEFAGINEDIWDEYETETVIFVDSSHNRLTYQDRECAEGHNIKIVSFNKYFNKFIW